MMPGPLPLLAAFGAAGTWAALFHVWSNSLTKGALFLSVGNIRRAAGARTIDEISGITPLTPQPAAIFVAGMFAITACPPFGPFFSVLRMLRSGVETGHSTAAGLFLGGLLFVFFGLTRLAFAIVDSRPRMVSVATVKRFPETASVIVPPLVLLGLSLWLGLGTPPILQHASDAAVQSLFSRP
jgi:hydrogenase-4 component F